MRLYHRRLHMNCCHTNVDTHHPCHMETTVPRSNVLQQSYDNLSKTNVGKSPTNTL